MKIKKIALLICSIISVNANASYYVMINGNVNIQNNDSGNIENPVVPDAGKTNTDEDIVKPPVVPVEPVVPELKPKTWVDYLDSKSVNCRDGKNLEDGISFQKCKNIKLSQKDIDFPTELMNLTNVKNIIFSDNILENVDFFAGLKKANTIDLSNNPIKNISGFSSLEEINGDLNLSGTDLIDFTGLSNLRTVNSITIDNIKTLSSFNGLQNIKSLDDGNLTLSNIPNIKDQKGLNIEEISGNLVITGKMPDKLNVLNKIKTVKKIEITNTTGLKDISDISNIQISTESDNGKGLKNIEISGNKDLIKSPSLNIKNEDDNVLFIDNIIIKNNEKELDLDGLKGFTTVGTINIKGKIKNYKWLSTIDTITGRLEFSGDNYKKEDFPSEGYWCEGDENGNPVYKSLKLSSPNAFKAADSACNS